MNKVQFYGLLLNLIIYLIMIFPIILISFNKKIYENKLKFLFYLCFSIIINILFSIVIYTFSRNIFSFISKTPGIINYAVYASKIVFTSSSLYSINFLIPAYLFINNKNWQKKSAILFLSKIAVHLILGLISFYLFNMKGILFSIPICDIVYYAIYIILISFN